MCCSKIKDNAHFSIHVLEAIEKMLTPTCFLSSLSIFLSHAVLNILSIRPLQCFNILDLSSLVKCLEVLLLLFHIIKYL